MKFLIPLVTACAASLLCGSAWATITPQGCADAKAYNRAQDGVSLVVLEDGVVVCEDYAVGDAATPHDLHSGSKSFLGVLAAAAVQDGLLTLDEKVSDTIPEWKSDPLKAPTTLRQLLSLTSGLPSTIGQVPTFANAIAMPFNAPPGQTFQYGPAPFQVFGEVLRRKLVAHGQPGDPLIYLRTRILDPIGVKYADWEYGKDQMPLLPRSAKLTAREWAKFGEFVRAGGKVNGQMIVDPAAFAELFRGTSVNPAYGLTWWLPKPSPSKDVVTALSDMGKHADQLPTDLVAGIGAGQQMLYVIPSMKLTIVRQAKLDIMRLLRQSKSGPSPKDYSDYRFLSLLLAKPLAP